MSRSMLSAIFGVVLMSFGSPVASTAEEVSEARFAELQQKYSRQYEKYREELGKTETENQANLLRKIAPFNLMVPEFLELEESCRGTATGLSCLHHLVLHRGSSRKSDRSANEGVRKALTILRDHYVSNPQLDLVLSVLNSEMYAGAFFQNETLSLYDACASSPHRNVRAASFFFLAENLQLKASIASTRNQIRTLFLEDDSKLPEESFMSRTADFLAKLEEIDRKVDPVKARERALNAIDSILRDYPSVRSVQRHYRGPIDLAAISRTDDESRETYGELAKKLKRKIESLNIGCIAPELAQKDIAGNDFKLSDRKGSVVAVFFSWKGCGPCVAMYPEIRKLVESMDGRPFVFLGVMSDEKQETVRDAKTQGDITWNVVWEGADRPLSQEWDVISYPSLYLIDHEGIIQYKHLRHELLDRAVEKLVRAAEEDQK